MSSIFPKARWNQIDLQRPSLWSLLIANALPLFGVLFFGWSTFGIVVIYWAENLLIGVINILKIITCFPSDETIAKKDHLAKVNPQAIKIFLIPFFTFHYGIFCLVHGTFVFGLLSGDKQPMPRGAPMGMVEMLRQLHAGGFTWALVGLGMSHLISFFSNYLGKGEFQKITPGELMAQPYGRIVVLHIAILFGAFLIMSLGSPFYLLMILIAGKTLLDVALHLSEHAKFAADEGPTAELPGQTTA